MSLPPEHVDLRFPVDTGCIGCSPTNPAGMRLLFRREGQEIVGRYAVPCHFSGAPQLVHGGILALLLDEYSCAAGYFLKGKLVITGSLEIRYERPAPIDEELEIRARILSDEHPKYWQIECRIFRAGQPVARSEGRFFPAPELHEA
jgi:hypothetical protein